MGTFILLLGHGITIALLIQLTLVLKCVRERALLILVLLSTIVGLLEGLMPALFQPVMSNIRAGSHLVWLLCSTISFSLLVSAVRNGRPSAKSQA